MEQLIRHRREIPEIAFGKWTFLAIADPAVLALSYEWGDRQSIIIHNLASKEKKVTFRLGSPRHKPSIVDRFGEGDIDIATDGTVSLDLAGYGYRWLKPL
jgi:maltose alpha-D-glucosyltransferase/alpha-amylase